LPTLSRSRRQHIGEHVQRQARDSFWWPEQVDLGPLRDHDQKSSPYGDDFDYAKAFASVDIKELKATSKRY